MLVWACLLVVVARVPAMAAWHLDAAPTVALVFAGALHNDLHLKRGTNDLIRRPWTGPLNRSALGGRIYASYSSRADVET